ATNEGSYPPEFESLVGKKMLFAVERGAKQVKISDGSYRVKRVCIDPVIIDKFCALGSCSTPVNASSQVVELDSEDNMIMLRLSKIPSHLISLKILL
ncbi:replication factor A protein, partial [Trifolium medium]|nr:replication factor A protein [Trifolium medium]